MEHLGGRGRESKRERLPVACRFCDAGERERRPATGDVPCARARRKREICIKLTRARYEPKKSGPSQKSESRSA